MLLLKQSTAVDVLIGPFLDVTDAAAAETGETPTVKLSKNGQALAAKNDVTTPTSDADGFYNCELDATDTGTVGTLVLSVAKTATALPVRHEFQIVEEAVYDAMYGASAAGPLQSTTAGRTLDVTATGAAGIDWGNVENKTTANDLSGTDIQLADTVTTNTDMVSAAPTAAAVADAVWNEDATAHQTGGTFGQAIGDPGANTETMYDAIVTDAAGTNVAADVIAMKAETALILADTGTTLDNHLTDIKGTGFVKDTHSLIDIETYVDILDDGTSGNVKIATDVANILVDTGTTLDNHLTDIKGTGFVKDTHSLIDIETYVDILDDGTSGNAKIATDVANILVDTATTIPGTITTLQADTDDIQTRLPAALVGGAMDADVSVIQADAVSASALATDAVNEIRDAMLPTQNVAYSNIEFLWVAASDHVTPVTGASTTSVTRSIDGGAFGAGTGTLAEVGNGIYQYDASQADMNGGIITFRFVATGGTPGAPDDAFLTIVTGGGV